MSNKIDFRPVTVEIDAEQLALITMLQKLGHFDLVDRLIEEAKKAS